MRNILILIALPLLMACAYAPMNESACSASTGNPIKIHYGDSQIKVTPPKYNVKKGEKLNFKLLADPGKGPDGLDYKTVTVSIVAKDTKNKNWLNLSGKDDGPANNVLTACMPESQPTGPDKVISYMVKVEKVGELDPRVEVTP